MKSNHIRGDSSESKFSPVFAVTSITRAGLLRLYEVMTTAQAPQPAQPHPEPHPAPSAAPSPSLAAPKAEEIDHMLDQSIEDAYTLLNFACRNIHAVPPGVAQVIIESHAAKQANSTLTASQENAFWSAFAAVIELVKPVTVESIVYTTASKGDSLACLIGGDISPGERTLRRHLMLAIFTLFALLVLQVQWAMGTSIYNDAHQVYANALQANTDNPPSTSSVPQDDATWHKVPMAWLLTWNQQISPWVPLTDLSNIERMDSVFDTQERLHLELSRAKLALHVISNYYLVTLFALLGALTHALRHLSQKMVRVALTSNAVFRGMTRIILGVISGVCLAWLYIITSQSPGAANASAVAMPLDAVALFGAFAPWALAFVSGYSVEIFFAALERFIDALTAKIRTRPKDQGDKPAGPSQAAPQPAPKPTEQPAQPMPAPPAAPAQPPAPAPAPPPHPQPQPPGG